MAEHIPSTADERLKQLNEVLRSFRLITRETDVSRMLERSCQVLTEINGYLHAWIYLSDEQGKMIQVIQAGTDGSFKPLEEKIMRGDTVYCVSEALKRPGIIVIDNRNPSCADCPFSKNYRDGHGMVCRLEYGKRVFGTLTVYSEHKLVGNPDEQEFIADFASDIAYSLFSNEQSDIRGKERKALKESEERYRHLFENSASGVAVYKAVDDGKNFIFKEFNRKAEEIEQKDQADVINKRITDVFPGAEAFGLLGLLQRVWTDGNPGYLSEALYRDAEDSGSWRENRVYKLPGGEIVAVYNDITERKSAEAALIESEHRHRAMFNNFPDAIFIADTQTGEIVDANPAASDLLKMPVEKIIGLHQSQLHPPEKKIEAKEIFKQHQADAEKNHPSSLSEAEILRSDKVRVPVEIKAQLVTISGKLYLQGVFRDITKRKESEDVLKSIFKASPAGIGYVGSDRTLLRVNEKICEMTGRTMEELVGKKSRILYRSIEDYEALGDDKYDQILKKGTGIVETRWVRENGELLEVLISSTAIDPSDFSKGSIFTALDITEWKLAKKEIIKLSQAVEQSPASIVITGADGRIEYINPKFTQITGFTLDEIRGQNPNILKSGNTSPEEYRHLWDTITGGNVWEGEFHNKTKDGEFFWEKATVAPIFNEEKKIINFLAVKKDITEQKALEEQLRQSQKMEAIGLLAGGIAHDFNNLLTIINGYSGIILSEVDRFNPVFEKVRQIMAAGERAASLTRQLLAFSRKQVLSPEVIGINNLISRMEMLLRRLIGEDIDLVMLYSDQLKSVKADQGQIEQVIMNLVVNARDAMPTGGCLTFETKNLLIDEHHAAFHTDIEPGDYVMIRISDTGMGMSEKIRDQIFDPFFTTKEPGKGTGLGLSTVYGIVRQSRGLIQVSSEAGKGTAFEIYLPALDETNVSAARNTPVDSVRGSETIMVVEDEESVRELTVLALTHLGYQVIQAENGIEALERIEEKPDQIQMVLTDMVMPQMGGPELAEKIIQSYPAIRLVFISGYTEQSNVDSRIHGKKIDFIQKPFSIHRLAQKIREIFDRSS